MAIDGMEIWKGVRWGAEDCSAANSVYLGDHSAHIRQPTTACSFLSRCSDALFWCFPVTALTCTCTYPYPRSDTQAHTFLNFTKRKKKSCKGARWKHAALEIFCFLNWMFSSRFSVLFFSKQHIFIVSTSMLFRNERFPVRSPALLVWATTSPSSFQSLPSPGNRYTSSHWRVRWTTDHAELLITQQSI